MLPRIATPVTVPIQSPQEAGSDAAPGAGRPQLSPEALANLRAAVVLRLLEAMMRQIGQAGEPGNAARQLLDVLLAALKTLPPGEGRDGEATRRLAILIARLPAEMRPAAERLLSTVLSSASTRMLMEVIRNPGGPDAQHLAQALVVAAGDVAADADAPVAHGGQRFNPAEAQLAAAARQASAAPQPGRDATGDSRSLQNALRQLFEGTADVDVDPDPTTGPGARPGAASGPAAPSQQIPPPQGDADPAADPGARPGAVSGTAAPSQENPPQADAARAAVPGPDNRSAAAQTPRGDATATARQGDTAPGDRAGPDQARPFPGGALQTAPLETGLDDARVSRAASPSSAAGPAPLNGQAEAPAARAPSGPGAASAVDAATAQGEQEAMMRLIAGVVANLTEDEALVLRLLLNVPLPEVAEAAASEDADATRALPRVTVPPEIASAAVAAGGEPEPPATEAANAARAAPRPQEHADESLAASRPPVGADEADAQARTAAAAVPAQAERPALPLFVRDGLGVPFVPYLTAQDDLETQMTPRGEEAEDEEEADHAAGEGGGEQTGENGGGKAAGDGDAAADTDGPLPAGQADTPEMARRRAKIEDLVGPPDPGFAYYQKLGEYWT